MTATKTLRALLWVMGVAVVAIAIYHLAGGIFSVPGTASFSDSARATVDSRERFYSAIFAGYGLGWIWAARQPLIPTSAVDALAGVFLLGGLGRVVSLLGYGWPHWFQVPEAGIELVLPFLFFALAARERATQQQVLSAPR